MWSRKVLVTMINIGKLRVVHSTRSKSFWRIYIVKTKIMPGLKKEPVERRMLIVDFGKNNFMIHFGGGIRTRTSWQAEREFRKKDKKDIKWIRKELKFVDDINFRDEL
jgi:hypothetical protein